MRLLILTTIFWTTLVPLALAAERTDFFKVRVVDDQTDRGVPLVELTTVSKQRFITDSAGVVAIREPDLFGQTVFFHVNSHGYEFPKDRFGFRGQPIKVEPGGEATLKIKRLNIAERLYRVTGAGIYADSVLLGEKPPIAQPLLNSQIAGSDSVVTAIYQGKLYWFWGDTNRPKYPLGLFHVPGATSRLPTRVSGSLSPASGERGSSAPPANEPPHPGPLRRGGGEGARAQAKSEVGRSDVDATAPPIRDKNGVLLPEFGIDLEYFVDDDGFAKAMCEMPGDGPTWIGGLTVLKDDEGRERLFCGYVKVRGMLEVYERGIAEFDDERREFVHRQRYDKDVPLYPDGHPFRHKVDGVEYVYFSDAAAVVRVRATVKAFRDLSQYEGFSCLVPGGRAKSPQIERSSDDKVVWSWKRDTAPIRWSLQEALRQSGQLKPDEAWLKLTDADTGKPVIAHNGSVTWNEHRRRWVSIFTQHFGTSLLGEIWYSEADAPEGPWLRAKKIVTHDKYSFYNPKQHPQFAAGRCLFFEGTYTHTFSGNNDPTPRYDYNQIMYRLDLDDTRLNGVHPSQ